LACIALYRQNRFEDAAQAFSRSKDKISKFNRGNAFAKSGDLQAAIEQYESALQIDAEFEDAAFNLELVKQVMQQAERAQGQQEKLNEKEERDAANAGQSSDSPERDTASDDRGENAEYEKGGNPDQVAEHLSEADQHLDQEQAQLMEQWLREVPDDPSGLLRRRFHYEYQERGKPRHAGIAW